MVQLEILSSNFLRNLKAGSRVLGLRMLSITTNHMVSILADLMCFLNLTQHSQTSAFLDHIVIKKKFSSDCEVYEGVKKGGVNFQLVSEVRELPPKSQKFHKIEGRGLPMAFHNLQSVQKRGAERGAQF